jgi:hypothetical protein
MAQDPIECTIEHVVLNSNADYEAVSYTWGDSGHESFIKCNNAQLEVRCNLRSALQHLRYADRPRLLWFDRLCINQDDKVEKSYQVAMMGEIFSSATSVLIWLGVPEVSGLLPVEIIKLVCEKVSDLLRLDVDMQVDKIQAMNQQELQDQFGIPLPTDEFWHIVNRILDQPWFRRSWTYQEVLLARNVQLVYGDRSVPFSVDHGSSTGALYSFEAFLLIVRLLGVVFGEAYVLGFKMRLAISMVRGRALQQFYPMDLLSNLVERRFCETTDPRDKIYALLGVAQDSKEVGPVPAYSSSVAEVYTITARRLIEKHGLLVLSCVENQLEMGCPSWVPDWSQTQREGFGSRRNNRDKVYNATGSSKPHFGNAGSAFKLSAQGMYFDTITSIGRYADNKSGWIISDIVLDGGEWSTMATDLAPDHVYKPTGELIEQAFARVRVADVWPDDNRMKRSAATRRSLPSTLPDVHDASPGSDELRRKVFEQTICRSFIITEQGYMGLGPASALEGDRVYLLFGGEVPYVLRSAGGDFTYVGGCYIHGIMDGEGLAKHRARVDESFDAKDLFWLDELEASHSFLQPEEVVLI